MDSHPSGYLLSAAFKVKCVDRLIQHNPCKPPTFISINPPLLSCAGVTGRYGIGGTAVSVGGDVLLSVKVDIDGVTVSETTPLMDTMYINVTSSITVDVN